MPPVAVADVYAKFGRGIRVDPAFFDFGAKNDALDLGPAVHGASAVVAAPHKPEKNGAGSGKSEAENGKIPSAC